MTRILTPAQELDVIARYRSGCNQLALAREFECSRPVIRGVLDRHGIDRMSRSHIQQQLSAIRLPERRAAMAAMAHEARRGSRDEAATLCRRAITRQEKGIGVSPAETVLKTWLEERGVECIPQQAIGPYNADLGADPVAVEINGGGWHGSGRAAERAAKRGGHILDAGWNLIIIWVSPHLWPLSTGAADYVVAFVERSRRDPSFRRQHRVIWGNGEETPTSRFDLDHITDIPPTHRG